MATSIRLSTATASRAPIVTLCVASLSTLLTVQLLVDSGDTVDGNGLVDADPGVKGHLAREILAQMPYDLLTVGNRAWAR